MSRAARRIGTGTGSRTRAALIALACLAAATLAGCSQVAAVAPVGGDHEAEVRYAAIDVLLAHGTEILVAPVCTSEPDGAVTCAGETVDGAEITASSTAADPTALTVRVGDDTVYDGSILDVLERAARGES